MSVTFNVAWLILWLLTFQVTKLDVGGQTAVLEDGTKVKYGKCLIATGGKPRNIDQITSAGPEVISRTTLFRSVSYLSELNLVS